MVNIQAQDQNIIGDRGSVVEQYHPANPRHILLKNDVNI